LRVIIITLFPEIFSSLINYGVLSRAFSTQKVSLDFINPRDFVFDTHKTVDDRPFGGGPGMVMLAEPIAQSIEQAKKILPDARVIYLSPQGKKFDQAMAEELINLGEKSDFIFLCGRYEGVDQRVLDSLIDFELSLGDFVLSGGELALMCILDAMIRLIPGVLGDSQSALEDSFSVSLNNNRERVLDHPHYTRPPVWRGLPVPEVLLSGHHVNIQQWRREKALEITQKKRPDLLKKIK